MSPRQGNTVAFALGVDQIFLTKFDQKPGELGLALGVLDDDPGARPTCHVFVGSKASWHEITDDLSQYEAFPPE